MPSAKHKKRVRIRGSRAPPPRGHVEVSLLWDFLQLQGSLGSMSLVLYDKPGEGELALFSMPKKAKRLLRQIDYGPKVGSINLRLGKHKVVLPTYAAVRKTGAHEVSGYGIPNLGLLNQLAGYEIVSPDDGFDLAFCFEGQVLYLRLRNRKGSATSFPALNVVAVPRDDPACCVGEPESKFWQVVAFPAGHYKRLLFPYEGAEIFVSSYRFSEEGPSPALFVRTSTGTLTLQSYMELFTDRVFQSSPLRRFVPVDDDCVMVRRALVGVRSAQFIMFIARYDVNTFAVEGVSVTVGRDLISESKADYRRQVDNDMLRQHDWMFYTEVEVPYDEWFFTSTRPRNEYFERFQRFCAAASTHNEARLAQWEDSTSDPHSRPQDMVDRESNLEPPVPGDTEEQDAINVTVAPHFPERYSTWGTTVMESQTQQLLLERSQAAAAAAKEEREKQEALRQQEADARRAGVPYRPMIKDWAQEMEDLANYPTLAP